jgi:hypothetical protein
MLKFTLFSISKFVSDQSKPFVGELINDYQYCLILKHCVKKN